MSLILVHGRMLSVLEICIFSNFPHRNVNGCDSRVGALSRLWKKSQVGQILCREPFAHFADLFITARGMLRGADIDR